jgi:hypothetical protein
MLNTWARLLAAFTAGLVLVSFPLLLQTATVAHPVSDIRYHSDYSQLNSSVSGLKHELLTLESIPNISSAEQSAGTNRGFWVSGYLLEHQHMTNTVNIAVDYTLKDNSSALHTSNSTVWFDRITQFLTEYPNEDDFWEIVNRKLTQTMLQEHPELRSLTISLEVLPRATIPYSCTSTVTATDQNQLIQKWKFISFDNPVHHWGRETVKASVEYTYRSEIADQDYPDFVPIQQQLTEQLETHAKESESWEDINRHLATMILAEHSTLTDITVELQAMPTSTHPYTYSTSASLTK